jgi:hypothetical protein
MTLFYFTVDNNTFIYSQYYKKSINDFGTCIKRHAQQLLVIEVGLYPL